MSDRSDHLIERAAALLRGANAGQVVNGSDAPAAAPGRTVPQPSVRAEGRSKSGQGQRGRDSLALGAPQSRLSTGYRSVAELRGELKHRPVSLADLERAGMMVARTNRTRTTEEYRIVIGRVLRALHDGQGENLLAGPESCPNVVMVTSARPGEGKSFTSLNLGGSIAQNAGESVLIVDVDAKNNSLSDLLGLSTFRGYLDMVADPALAAEDLIIPSALPNLSFLALGSRSLAREEEGGSGAEERRMTPPITRLARQFPKTLILIDAPPCLSTSDPHTLSPAVGQVVLVVEAERTQRSEVEAAIEMVKVCPNVTMLLNKVRMNSSHTFGTYDYFGTYT